MFGFGSSEVSTRDSSMIQGVAATCTLGKTFKGAWANIFSDFWDIFGPFWAFTPNSDFSPDFGAQHHAWNCEKKIGRSHAKSQEHSHVLAPIVGKDLGHKFLLGIALGVLEGLIKRGFIWFSILTPSSDTCHRWPVPDFIKGLRLSQTFGCPVSWNPLYKRFGSWENLQKGGETVFIQKQLRY